MVAPGTVSEQQELYNYVDGEWTETSGTDGQDVVNPATNEKLGRVPFSTDSDTDATVERAREAFEDWRSTPVEERNAYSRCFG